MRILRVTAEGLPLFPQKLDLVFYAQQRVDEEDERSLYHLGSNVYLNTATALIGLNASGKTSILRILHLALEILRNQSINYIEGREILGGSGKVILSICYAEGTDAICRLDTEIIPERTEEGYRYSICEERFWEKSFSGVRSRKSLTDFEGRQPSAMRSRENQLFLPEDVSFIIARNRRKGAGSLPVCSLLPITDINVVPVMRNVSPEIVRFLDPSIESMYFEEGREYLLHLKFIGKEEILIHRPTDLQIYLSSGTIKGITTFSLAQRILRSGGYLLVDEIENHFNREIVTTLIRFFTDSDLNRSGGTLIYTTHYPELLDIYDRNDSIYVVRNQDGITAENLCHILKRNDIRKSEAYQSDFLGGTAPVYDAYLQLKKSIRGAAEQGG